MCIRDSYSITVNGQAYDENNPSGTETLISSQGCDSIIMIDLIYAPNFIENVNYVGCEGDGYGIIINGVSYNENNPSGSEIMVTSQGCDSIINVALVYNPEVSVEAGMLPYNICSSTPFVPLEDLNASISGGTNQGMWTSIGDGSFDVGGIFNEPGSATKYTLGPNDIAAGEVILTLTSIDPQGPCEPAADAVLILINDLTCSQFPWAGN